MVLTSGYRKHICRTMTQRMGPILEINAWTPSKIIPSVAMRLSHLGSGLQAETVSFGCSTHHCLYQGFESLCSSLGTFPPQEFRIGLEWRSRRSVHRIAPQTLPADLLSSSMPSITSTKTGEVVARSTRFHVPDDDDEIDSSSESSREASVEILDSHVRAYSVPSSEEGDSTSDDEEDLSILKDVPLSQSATNANIPTAQPPNIAGTTLYQVVESESYSSKEPEVLRPCEMESFVSSSVQMNGSGSLGLFPTADEEDHYSLISDIEDEPPEVLSSKRTVAGSAPHVLFPSSTQAANSSLLPGGTPFEPNSRNAGVAPAVVKPSQNPEKSTMESPITDAHVQIDDSPLSRPVNSSSYDLESADGEGVDFRSPYPPYPAHNPSALADHNLFSNHVVTYTMAPGVESTPPAESTAEQSQISSMSKSDYPRFTTNCKTIAESHQKDSAHKASVPQRPPSPSDAALVKKAKFVDQRSFWPVMEQSQGQSLIETSSEYETQFNETQVNETQMDGQYVYCGFGSSPWLFSHLRPADRPSRYGSTTEPAPPSLSETTPLKSVVEDRPVEPAHVRSYMQSCTSPDRSDDPDPSILVVPHHQPKEYGYPSSRLNISDIVHPQLESSRNLKRKADDMSVDDAEAVPFILPSETSQEVLTDAQPRDIISADETISLEESSNLPVDVAISVQEPLNLDSPEPPRKKVKTSVTTAIGIGRFVSGVCFGVAGVFAAFIATIPLSVRQEAMQELVNSA